MAFRGQLQREFRSLLDLAVPLVLGELGWMTMSLVDTMMVGRVSKEAIGAVSLGGMLFYAVAVIGMGILLGLDTLVSQSYGAGNTQDCHHSLIQALYLCLPLAPLLMGLQWCWSLLLAPFGVHPAVIAETTPYLKAIMWSTFPLLLYAAMRRYLQGMNLVKPVMFALISANLVNAGANWVLIFGNLGFPAYGAAGAGWATCISRVYMALVLVVYIYIAERKGLGLMRANWSLDLERIRRLVSLGLPAATQIVVEVGVFALVTVLIGKLEPRFLAAHQIAISAASFTYMVPLGLGAAAAVRVGQAIGRRDGAGAGRAGWAAMTLGGATMSWFGLMFLLAPGWVARVFTTDPEVITAAGSMLAVAAVFQLFDGLQGVATGALRGAGDTRTAAASHLIGYWVIGLPLGYYLCFSVGWGAVGLWAGLCLSLIAIGVVLTGAWWRMAKRICASYP
ncbi:MAG: MATE family efflux transporter [Acidobacteriia bacterium]|nr:MATE family efflux transporter [Terriglobia bacterium]